MRVWVKRVVPSRKLFVDATPVNDLFDSQTKTIQAQLFHGNSATLSMLSLSLSFSHVAPEDYVVITSLA